MRKRRRLFSGFFYKFREKDFDFFCLMIVSGSFLIFTRGLDAGLNPGKHSFFELYLWSMGDAVNIVFIHTIVFLTIVSKLFLYGTDDIIFILHQDSKRNIWTTNICSALIATLLYLAGTSIAMMLMSINKEIISVTETEFIRGHFNKLFYIAYSHPSCILIGIIGNGIAYFFCIALILYIFLYQFKKRSIALIWTLMIVFLDYIVYLCKIHTLERYTMLGNLLLCYGRGSGSVTIHIFYWIPALGFLCLLSYRLTQKNDIIKNDCKSPGICKALASVIYFWKGKKLFFTIIISALYFNLAYKYTGDYSGTVLTNLYVGSDRIDVKFLLWLLLELVTTLYVTNRIYQLLNYNTSIRILRLKNRKEYASYLSYILLIETVCFFLVSAVVVSMCLWIKNGNLHISNFQQGSGGLILWNTFVGMLVFSYCVCLLNTYMKNFAQSYLIIFVIQQLHMVLYRLFGNLCGFLPLLHGCVGLYRNNFNIYVALGYQITEVIILHFLFRNQLSKYIGSE